jgi:hypothetical protein
MNGEHLGLTLSSLGQVPVENQPWVERMASLYIKPGMNGEHRGLTLISLGQVPVGNQPWMERMALFVVTPIDFAREVWDVINQLSFLTLSLSTDALREEARLGIIAGVNRAREEGLPLSDFFRQLLTLVRDEVTQNARINPAAAGPEGRAMEVHFASSFEVPLEEGGRSFPLYKAIHKRLHTLGFGNGVTLRAAVATVGDWIGAYAKEHQALYQRVLTKGYGDGVEMGYNQEITPLLRFVVPCMERLGEAPRKAWLLPALQEAATAYDAGDSVSCAKGIQERLTVVGLDVEGVDPMLRSLSKMARDYLYIVDPTTNGADAWIKKVVCHLTSEERCSLLEAEKPEREAFDTMFWRPLSVGLQGVGLLPFHAEFLLQNEHVRTSFNNSLEMHYEYDQHYAALQEEVRAAERGLPRAVPQEPGEELDARAGGA